MSRNIIRKANASDSEKLLVLIKELSKELRLTSSQLTQKELDDDAFGKSAIFTVYVSQSDEGDLTGYVLFYNTYSTWEGRSLCVEELFVTASQRRKGIGSSLLKKAVQEALKRGCSRCNITAFPGNKFLASQGAIDLTDTEKWLFFRMNRKAMEDFSQRCKNIEGAQIRESTQDDVKSIRKLIQDLADYEEMPDGPKIAAATLREDSLENEAFYKCYVAEAEGQLVGYSIFFFTYNGDGAGVYMEDLYVSPEYRKKGIGIALWGNVIKAGLNIEGKRCDFAVLDWNTPSIDFYKHMGAIDMTQERGFHFYRMTKDIMNSYVNTT
ncbi:spermidine/spermine N(1)-acetyltransferase-like protein 1 isoform X2 [Palaemon carinicauda]|uniref:spermidine/spermine N(1)-acetyltransferase-like protein 1 isoform X2 n=1 Tax=Palaemon carinicauda TaxID=392227 RepID=UPI0035B5ED9C